MKSIVLQAAVLASLAGPPLPAQAPARPAASYKQLQYPPLHKIQVPEPVRFEMPNGIVVYLVEDHELPTIDAAARVRVGTRWEPADKAGLASLTGTVMRTGGSQTRKGDDLDQEFDRLGGHVETFIGEDFGGGSVSVLKEDIHEGLTVLADLLQHPAFPQDKIDLAKIALRDAIARRNDQPAAIAGREFRKVIFGQGSPYAHQSEYATIEALDRQDLVDFHARFFQPENVILGVWGDFRAGEMRAEIEKTFGGWARGGHPKPEVPPVAEAARHRAGIYLANKDDATQSTVYIGMLGGRYDDPDYFALSVMNDVLGGGFSSRLFSQVRSEQGLAYAVGSSWAAGWDRPGIFAATGGTKSQTTVKIIQAIRHEIDRIGAGVTEDELSRAKEGILKGAAFDFDSTGKIVQRLIGYEYYGYPRDFLQRYQEGIGKVTREDVARVAAKYLKSAEMAVVVVGKAKDFDPALTTLGQVTALDIAIPPPPQARLAAATPESAARGRELMSAVRKAMGGPALDSVKDVTSTGEMLMSTPQGEITLQVETTINLGGKMLSKMTTPMGEMVQGFDGSTGWMKSPRGVQELPASRSADLEGPIQRESIALVRNYTRSGVSVQALAPAGGLEGVAISDPARNLQVKLFIDPKTHLITRKEYTGTAMGPPAEVEEIYDDYREVNGIHLPFHVVMNSGGKKRAEVKLTSIRINPGLDEAAYRKP